MTSFYAFSYLSSMVLANHRDEFRCLTENLLVCSSFFAQIETQHTSNVSHSMICLLNDS